jgi:hypothetical protein
MLPWSDWGVPLAAERKDGTKVKFAASLHCRFDSPTTAVQENGTYGGTKAKPLSVGALAALLFEQALNTRSAKANRGISKSFR